ncbi:MAG: PfkB family carbohydrate kinase [Candidatus Methanodesulfokora sp.]
MPSFLAAGNLSRDLIKTSAGESIRLAGSSIYAGVVAAKLGFKAVLLACYGQESDLDEIPRDLSLEGLIRRGKTASFELVYHGEDRELRLLSSSEPIYPSDVEKLGYHDICLSSPIYHEISLETLRELRRRCFLLGLDPQGYIRRADEHGRVSFYEFDGSNYFYLADVLSTSKPELPYIAKGERDEARALKLLWDMGPDIVIMTREGGSDHFSIFFDGKLFSLPAVPPSKIVDPGGAGDSSTAAFLVEYYMTGNPLWSALFASSVSSFIYEGFGAERVPSRDEAIRRLDEFLLRNAPELREIMREFL